MKRLLLLSLSFILLIGVLLCAFSCSKEEAAPQNESIHSDMKLIDEGKAMYSIVYSDRVSDALYNRITAFTNAIYKVTGVKIEAVKKSWIGKAANDRYIYIGKDSCDQAAEAADTMEFVDAYSIARVGDDVVFTALYNDALYKALEYYTSSLLEKNYNAETKTLVFEEFFFAGEEPFPTTFDCENLEKYVIVYPAGDMVYKEVALLLRDYIKLIQKCELPVVSTASEVNPYEIVVGKSDRSISQAAYATEPDIMKAHVLVEKGQVQIVSGGPYSAQSFVKDQAAKFLRSKDFSLSEGTHYHLDLLRESHTLTEGSDVRIMTLNVLAGYVVDAKDQDALPVAMRAEIFAGMLIRYQPDMIGLQECDGEWINQLRGYLPLLREKHGLDYSHILTSYQSLENVTSILYNTKRFRCDEAEYYPYEYTGENGLSKRTIRGAGVAKLTSLLDPAVEILLFTSHWDHTSEEAMNSCAKEEAAIVKLYEEKYPNASVFCTGDFNSHKFEGVYLNQFVSEINGAIASDLAREGGTLIIDGGYHTAGFIDHIIGRAGSYSVLYHNTLLVNGCDQMTDHAPIYADIKLLR